MKNKKRSKKSRRWHSAMIYTPPQDRCILLAQPHDVFGTKRNPYWQGNLYRPLDDEILRRLSTMAEYDALQAVRAKPCSPLKDDVLQHLLRVAELTGLETGLQTVWDKQTPFGTVAEAQEKMTTILRQAIEGSALFQKAVGCPQETATGPDDYTADQPGEPAYQVRESLRQLIQFARLMEAVYNTGQGRGPTLESIFEFTYHMEEDNPASVHQMIVRAETALREDAASDA